MKKLYFAIVISLQFSSNSLWAADSSSVGEPSISIAPADEDTAQETVEITGSKNPTVISGSVMRRAIDAFTQHHELAPKTELLFKVKARRNHSLDGVTLNVVGKDSGVPVPIAEDGTFTVVHKQLEDKNAELVWNRKKESISFGPFIRTNKLMPNLRRLGDLRLECEVQWALFQDDFPFLKRNILRLAGGPCHSSYIAIFNGAEGKLTSATLISGERQQELRMGRDGSSFNPPLHDKSWSDDAVIKLQYATADTAVTPVIQADGKNM